MKVQKGLPHHWYTSFYIKFWNLVWDP